MESNEFAPANATNHPEEAQPQVPVRLRALPRQAPTRLPNQSYLTDKTEEITAAMAGQPSRRTLLRLVQATPTDAWALEESSRTAAGNAQRETPTDARAHQSADAAPQIVGVRDQESGCARIFTVYHPSPGAATGGAPAPDPDRDPDRDPDPPPAGPAQSRTRARVDPAAEGASDSLRPRAA